MNWKKCVGCTSQTLLVYLPISGYISTDVTICSNKIKQCVGNAFAWGVVVSAETIPCLYFAVVVIILQCWRRFWTSSSTNNNVQCMRSQPTSYILLLLLLPSVCLSVQHTCAIKNQRKCFSDFQLRTHSTCICINPYILYIYSMYSGHSLCSLVIEAASSYSSWLHFTNRSNNIIGGLMLEKSPLSFSCLMFIEGLYSAVFSV